MTEFTVHGPEKPGNLEVKYFLQVATKKLVGIPRKYRKLHSVNLNPKLLQEIIWKRDAQSTEMSLIKHHVLVRLAPTKALLNLGLLRKSRKKLLLMIQDFETFKENLTLIYYTMLFMEQDRQN